MGLMRKLTSALVASSLVLGLMGTAFAAPTADQQEAAYARMSALELVKGVDKGDVVDPALEDAVTRAQMVTIITRAFGQETGAKLLAGATTFADVETSHWATGYLAIAKNMATQNGFAIGYPDGTFQPEKNVTAVEALAFVMKYLGVPVGTGADWAADTIAAAKDAGVITDADVEAYLTPADAEATRGLAFALADSIFYNYNKLAGGKTVYTKYVDVVAPVVKLDAPAALTTDKAEITVTGAVTGEYTALFIGAEPIVANEDGTFSATVKLDLGANEIVVGARDVAGNVGEDTYTVTRQAGAAAKIAITAPESVVAGETADVTVKVLDANDADTGATDFTVTVGGEIGTYADGKFTAATKAGKGTITVTAGDLTATVDIAVVAGELAKVEAETASVQPGTAVKLVAKDAHGNVVEGATFSESEDNAFIDGNLFTATKAGTYAVKATVGEKTVEGTVAVFGKIAGLKITAPESVVANGASKFKVQVAAVDENGSVVTTFKNKIKYNDDLVSPAFKEIAAKNGVAEFEFTAPATLGDAEIDLIFEYDTDGKGAYTDKAFAQEISLVEQVATSIELKAPEYLTTNSTATAHVVTAKILDQVGKPMQNGAWGVTFKVSGPATFEYDETEIETTVSAGVTNKVEVFAEDTGESGTVTVTASMAGLTSGKATMKAAFAQAPKAIKLVAEDTDAIKVDNAASPLGTLDYAAYTVYIVDRNGVPNPEAEDVSVTLTVKDAGTGTLVSMADEDGDPTTWNALASKKINLTITEGQATFFVASTKAGTVSLSLTDAAKTLTASGSVSTTFKAEAPAYVGFKSDRMNVLRSESGSAVGFSAQVYDQFGNKAPVSGVKVEFQALVGTAAAKGVKLDGEDKSVVVSTDETGLAKVEATLAGYAANQFDLVVADGDDEDGYTIVTAGAPVTLYDTVAVEVVLSIAKTISMQIVDPADVAKRLPSFQAGVAGGIGLYVTVKDNHGFGLVSLDEADFSITSDGADDDLYLAPYDAEEDKGWVVEELGEGKYLITGIDPENAGTLTLTVKIATVSTNVEVSRSVAVRPGVATKVALAEGKSIVVKDGQVTELTIQAMDDFGNVVNASQVTETIKVTLDTTAGGTYADFRNVKGQPLPKVEVTLKPYVEIKAGTNSVKVQFLTDATGTYTLTLTPDTAGGFTTITVNE